VSATLYGVRRGRPKRERRKTQASSLAPYQVLVSHATADKWLAVALCDRIESAGATTFRDDRDIKGGDIIPTEIFSQIKRSKEFLVLLTPASVTRPWVLIEIGAACQCRGLRIVPVLYHVGIDPIPAMIHQNKGFSLNDFDKYLTELKARAKGRGK
jgi:hypothetical protein